MEYWSVGVMIMEVSYRNKNRGYQQLRVWADAIEFYIACCRVLRACLKITRGAAARDFGFGQGGEGGASPQRAVTTEPTPAKDKRPTARRVFAQKTVWLRCSSVEDPQGVLASQALPVRFPN